MRWNHFWSKKLLFLSPFTCEFSQQHNDLECLILSNKYNPCQPIQKPKFWFSSRPFWIWTTFIYSCEPMLVKKKDPPVFPWILVWSQTNSGEKERPSCMSLNFGMVSNQFWWKRKTLLYFPEFWYGREPILVKKNTLCRKPRLLHGREWLIPELYNEVKSFLKQKAFIPISIHLRVFTTAQWSGMLDTVQQIQPMPTHTKAEVLVFQ